MLLRWTGDPYVVQKLVECRSPFKLDMFVVHQYHKGIYFGCKNWIGHFIRTQKIREPGQMVFVLKELSILLFFYFFVNRNNAFCSDGVFQILVSGFHEIAISKSDLRFFPNHRFNPWLFCVSFVRKTSNSCSLLFETERWLSGCSRHAFLLPELSSQKRAVFSLTEIPQENCGRSGVPCLKWDRVSCIVQGR